MSGNWGEVEYKLFLHSRTLRSANADGEAYQWWHPSPTHLGNHPQKDDWWKNACWLDDDFRAQVFWIEDQFGELSDFAYSDLAGMVDAVILDARFGQLRQIDKSSPWPPKYGVEICGIVPGVAEIKLQKPIYVLDQKLLGRIYYSEPETPEILISLGFQLKLADSPNWKELQDCAIRLAQSRGDDWVTRWEKKSTP